MCFLADQKTIQFVRKMLIPEDKKVIILTSTPWLPVYQKLYGERLTIHDLGFLKNGPEVLQYAAKSFSQTSILNEPRTEKLYQEIAFAAARFRFGLISHKSPATGNRGLCQSFGGLEGDPEGQGR